MSDKLKISGEILTKENITLIIAMWGAVVSTFVAGCVFFRDFIHRGKLKIECCLSVTCNMRRELEHFISIKVTNIGKEQINVTGNEISLTKRENLAHRKLLSNLPKKLYPSDFITSMIPLLDIDKKIIQRMQSVIVTDSFGKKWNKKIDKALKRQFESFLDKE